VAIGFAIALIVIAIGRLASFGWADVAADDARYVYVGLSTLDGHGPVTPTGNLFILRSPVYGIALAAGSAVLGDGPIAGARIVAAILTIAGLLATVRLAWLLSGPIAAVGSTVALLAIPLIWLLLPTLRIDLPQATGVIATLLALLRPTPRRWAMAGVLFGLTVLVKETILLLAFAPLACVGTMPRRRLAHLWAIYLVSAAVVAGWWWVVVWSQSGAIFPLNAIGVIEARDVGSEIRLDLFRVVLLALLATAWLIVLVAARRDRRLRLLVVAAACLVPPAAYAMLNGLNVRNYAGLAVLSAVAVGVAATSLVAWARARSPRRDVSRVAAITLAAVLGVGVVVAGQSRVANPTESALPGQVVSWLRAEAAPGARVVMTFRYSEIVALELYGDVAVPVLGAVRVDPASPVSDYLWMGLRDRQLFGFKRSTWEAMIGQPGTTDLVLAGPHPLTPAELMPVLDRGALSGLTRAQSFAADGDWATIYRVIPGSVRPVLTEVPLHLSAAAANAWLDDAAAGPDAGAGVAAGRLAESGAVVVGPDTDTLARRLAGHACLIPIGTDAARVVASGPGCRAG
jgi:4-amino-4-deoxy-L-arabinose transferase-like glycosyltransferase